MRLTHMRWVVSATLAAVVASCSFGSGFGPFNAPDESQHRLIGAAAGWLASSDRLANAPVFILDHVDPQVVDAMRQTNPDFAEMLSPGENVVAAPLDPASQRAIRDRLEPGRKVSFVTDLASVPPGPPRVPTFNIGLPPGATCPSFQDGGTYVAIAPARALSVHGGAFLLVVEYSDGCIGASRVALWTYWEAGERSGGQWMISDVIEGGGPKP